MVRVLADFFSGESALPGLQVTVSSLSGEKSHLSGVFS